MHVPIAWAAAGFVCGVFVRSLFAFGWWTIGFVAFGGVVIFMAAYAARTNVCAAFVPALFVLCVAVGAARMHFAVFESIPALDASVGKKISIEGTVFKEPDIRESNTRLSVRTSEGAGVLVIAPLHSGISYGDTVRAEGVVRRPQSFETGAGRAFNYPAYLARDGIGYELSFAAVEKTGEGKKNPLKASAIWMKQTYLRGLSLALPEPQAGLAGGITVGDKRGLGAELSETFRIVGLIHIVVLSGYNIMVVIGFFERVFRRTHRYVRLSLGIVVPIFFALMTGLASSSVRAASMAVIASVGKTTGRTYLALRALALVAVGMVLWNPFVLAYDPGFQLSVIATWGLITLTPFVERYLGLVTARFGVRDIASATIGTQIAVLPLLLYQSGALSIFALPANMLTLIVVPYAMLLSFIGGTLGLITGPLAPLFAFPAYVLLSYITAVAQFFAWLPFSSLTIPAFSPIILVVLYGGLLYYLVFSSRAK